MDLGLNFEDDDLQCNKRNKTGDRHLPYNVKICTNQWFDASLQNFHEESEVTDLEEFQKSLKFSADYSYSRKDYVDASKKYKQLLDILSAKQSSALYHDAQESLCRCCMYTGEHEQGVEIARRMVDSASKEDNARQRQALALLSFACEKAHKWSECVAVSERLCELQPQFSQTFHKLGDVYNHLLPDWNQDVDNHIQMESQDMETTLVKQLSCYLRAKFLFQAVMGTATEFIRERNEVFIQQLTARIDQSPISSSRKEFASECIQKEVERQATSTKEISCEEKLSSADESDVGEFYEKFCSWNSLCPR